MRIKHVTWAGGYRRRQISFDSALSRHTAKQVTEFGVALTIKALREIAGRNIRPTLLSLMQSRANSRSAGVRAVLRLPGRVWRIGRSSRFLESRRWRYRLSPKIDTCSRRFGRFAMRPQKSAVRSTGSLRAAVENEAQKLLPHGQAKRHRVAKSLGHSERTLTRKLVDEGTTYEQVLDQLRQSLAPIHKGTRRVAFANCVASRLRGIGLFQSCFQAMDGPLAVSSAKRETVFCVSLRTGKE